MGAWSLYFLFKLALYYNRVIGLHWLLNTAFAVALAWPLARRRARLLRQVVAVPAAMALLYYDSYLPPWSRLVDQAWALSNFRADYLVELAQRVAPWNWLAVFAAACLLYLLLAHRLRFATLAFVGLAIAAVVPVPAPAPAPVDEGRYARAGDGSAPAAADVPGAALAPPQLDALLEASYGSEHGRTVSFVRAGPPQFDLVLLSVCSLSSDDLEFVQMQDAPLLARFDIVFRQFNSGATYSGPAVLRLLHGSCGQTPQRELYSDTASDACYLFRNLAADGYRPALLLNHDGHFDDFAGQLRRHGGLDVDPDDNRAAPAAMTSFDGTPIRADFELLSQWWRRHQSADLNDTAHLALLYNTISLHDGNRVPGLAGATSRDSYAPRLRRLFADLGRFLDLVEASGRPTVVVLIPEHGAALRADATQVSGLREIPSTAITRVPAAVKLIGFAPGARAAGGPLVVDRPASYLSLTTLIAGLTQLGPRNATHESLQTLARALPTSEWIAENEGNVLLRHGGRNYLREPKGSWVEVGGAQLAGP